jgi:hypothetical protein
MSSPILVASRVGHFKSILKASFSGLMRDLSGGNWLLGGRVLKDLSTFELGLRLVETCMQTVSPLCSLGDEIVK